MYDIIKQREQYIVTQSSCQPQNKRCTLYLASLLLYISVPPAHEFPKSYVVHPTSYIGSRFAAAWGRRACCTSHIGRPCLPPGAVRRHTRAAGARTFQIDSPAPSCRFAPVGATHVRCPSALTARCACALIGAVVRVVHRTSYLVHRQTPPATGRRQAPPSARRLHDSAPALASPNSRASAGTSSNRTSYIVHRK